VFKEDISDYVRKQIVKIIRGCKGGFEDIGEFPEHPAFELINNEETAGQDSQVPVSQVTQDPGEQGGRGRGRGVRTRGQGSKRARGERGR
jgi:hypothetical protein